MFQEWPIADGGGQEEQGSWSHKAVQCSAVQCSAVQCSAVQCSAVQCSAVSGGGRAQICHVLTRFVSSDSKNNEVLFPKLFCFTHWLWTSKERKLSDCAASFTCHATPNIDDFKNLPSLPHFVGLESVASSKIHGLMWIIAMIFSAFLSNGYGPGYTTGDN